jgi:hypothetical protein
MWIASCAALSMRPSRPCRMRCIHLIGVRIHSEQYSASSGRCGPYVYVGRAVQICATKCLPVDNFDCGHSETESDYGNRRHHCSGEAALAQGASSPILKMLHDTFVLQWSSSHAERRPHPTIQTPPGIGTQARREAQPTCVLVVLRFALSVHRTR